MAAQIDASAAQGPARRTILKTMGVGAAVLAGVPLLAACTGGSGPSASGSASAGLTFGSGSSDDVPKRAYQAVTDAFTAKTGKKVTTNVVPHNDFQNKINSYLQGSPTTPSPGSPATACSTTRRRVSWHPSTTSGRPSAPTTRMR